MKIEDLRGKNCYIFPKSPITETFKKYLDVNCVFVKGFIDNQKKENTFYLDDISSKDFDYILIFSPNHYRAIYEQTINSISKEKVIFVYFGNNNKEYLFTKDIEALSTIDSKEKYEKYFETKIKNYTLKDEVLFIGIGFLDLNIKYLYLFLKKHTNLKVYITTNNQRDIDIFKKYNIDVVPFFSEEFFDLVFRTKIKIVDQTPTDELLIKCLNIGKSIQLWHGITIEQLGVLANYKLLKYDVVLSTSNFVSDYSFSKIYLYDKLINCGYPRNDILYNDNIELINVDLELLDEIKNSKELKYVVYMPTHRLHSFESNPINYKELNDFGVRNSIKFIIKMHPLVAEKAREDLALYQDICDFSNLVIYPSFMDIYPILKYSDILISDYSSVYFDFLYTNKPIIFFCYDYKEWVESEGSVVLDYFSYSPGDKCYTFIELLNSILTNLKEDKYIGDRKRVFDQMFENKTQSASKLILEEIKGLLK